MQKDVMKLGFNVLQELESFINTKIGIHRAYKVFESLTIIASFFMSGEPPTYKNISDIMNYDINGKSQMKELLIELADEQNVENSILELTYGRQKTLYSLAKPFDILAKRNEFRKWSG